MPATSPGEEEKPSLFLSNNMEEQFPRFPFLPHNYPPFLILPMETFTSRNRCLIINQLRAFNRCHVQNSLIIHKISFLIIYAFFFCGGWDQNWVKAKRHLHLSLSGLIPQ